MDDGATRSGPRRKRGGGSSTRRNARLNAPVTFPKATLRSIPTYEVLDSEGLDAIDHHAMEILETIGIEFRDDASAAIWRDAGADVDGHRIRIPRALVRKLIATIPEEFDYHARNPERTVRIGGRNMIFGPA